jgi:hypothetical protein
MAFFRKTLGATCGAARGQGGGVRRCLLALACLAIAASAFACELPAAEPIAQARVLQAKRSEIGGEAFALIQVAVKNVGTMTGRGIAVSLKVDTGLVTHWIQLREEMELPPGRESFLATAIRLASPEEAVSVDSIQVLDAFFYW